ncbi:hypothetical protein AAVH_40747, partial [Aphelenchoides avenae]
MRTWAAVLLLVLLAALTSAKKTVKGVAKKGCNPNEEGCHSNKLLIGALSFVGLVAICAC